MGWGRLLDYLRKLWVDPHFEVVFSQELGTGYTKPPMLFKRPVDEQFTISGPYGEWGPMWSKHINMQGLWVDGQVTGKGQHKGVDFAVPEGTQIFAMYDGLIMRAGWENRDNVKQGFGLRVRQQIITEGGTPMTFVYGHLSRLQVQEGHQVAKGDYIGLSGKTGHVTGPHLHIELVDGKTQYHPIEFEQPLQTTA